LIFITLVWIKNFLDFRIFVPACDFDIQKNANYSITNLL